MRLSFIISFFLSSNSFVISSFNLFNSFSNKIYLLRSSLVFWFKLFFIVSNSFKWTFSNSLIFSSIVDFKASLAFCSISPFFSFLIIWSFFIPYMIYGFINISIWGFIDFWKYSNFRKSLSFEINKSLTYIEEPDVNVIIEE